MGGFVVNFCGIFSAFLGNSRPFPARFWRRLTRNLRGNFMDLWGILWPHLWDFHRGLMGDLGGFILFIFRAFMGFWRLLWGFYCGFFIF